MVKTQHFLFINGKPLKKTLGAHPTSSEANGVVSNAGNLKSMWNSLLMMIA